MKKWTVRFTPMKSSLAAGSAKLLDIPANSIVETTGETVVEWERCVYRTSRKEWIGWIHEAFIEQYIEGLPKDCVDVGDMQTEDTTDPAQYVLWGGYKQVNMCGEMCVAYLLGVPLRSVLEKWKADSLPFYKRVFGSGKARGTGDAELVDIFKTMGWPAKQLSPELEYYFPQALQLAIISNGGIIAGVKIDSATGRLRGQGVGHWVVPVSVHPERSGYGTIEIYNPFPNRIEVYSWAEFVASARRPFGAILT